MSSCLEIAAYYLPEAVADAVENGCFAFMAAFSISLHVLESLRP